MPKLNPAGTTIVIAASLALLFVDGAALAASVITPNGHPLRLREENGVKVGHLVAEEFEHEFAPGLTARVWGYNRSTPGPTIEATEGDRLRIHVTNRLPEPTSVH